MPIHLSAQASSWPTVDFYVLVLVFLFVVALAVKAELHRGRR